VGSPVSEAVDLVERLEELALKPDLHPRGRASVIRMLGKIGTSKALLALLRVAKSSGIEDENRVLALEMAEKMLGRLCSEAPQPTALMVEERATRLRPFRPSCE